MRKYETMYIIRPDLEEEARTQLIERFSALIKDQGGELTEVKEWGIRKMAYPIQDFKEGYYVLLYFSAGPEVVAELERVFKITDPVIRYMTIRQGE
jgi:small subunit ribosomal protein S6